MSEKEGVKHIQVYATKAGIIKTETDIQGVILKGIDQDYDWTFFKEYLVEGNLPCFSGEVSNEVLISKVISNRLQIALGDEFNILFVKINFSKTFKFL